MTDVNEQIPYYSFSFLHAFFFCWSWVVLLLFFFLFFSFLSTLFFCFSFGVALFFFSFRCWTFLLFHSEGYRICSCFWSLFLVSYFLLLLFSVLGFSPFSFWRVANLFFLLLVSFPCFLFSGGLVFSLSLSLSFNRLNKPLRNRFLLVLSRFSDRLRWTIVTQS